MLGSSEKVQEMFSTLKAMFPQIDTSIINQNLSFSENLQNLVGQLGIPTYSQSKNQIFHMKQMIDKQELKIQKSLVNQQDVLGNITNRTIRRQKIQKQQKSYRNIQIIQEEQSQSWHQQENNLRVDQKNHNYKANQNISDIIQDIWQLESGSHKDWFHH